MYTAVDEGEVEVIIRGSREEFRRLHKELSTWTPSGGWSPQTKQIFDELQRAGGLSASSE